MGNKSPFIQRGAIEEFSDSVVYRFVCTLALRYAIMSLLSEKLLGLPNNIALPRLALVLGGSY